jgi:hypothetical protein
MYTEEYKEMLIKKFKIIIKFCGYKEYSKIDFDNTPFDIINTKYYECVNILSYEKRSFCSCIL